MYLIDIELQGPNESDLDNILKDSAFGGKTVAIKGKSTSYGNVLLIDSDVDENSYLLNESIIMNRFSKFMGEEIPRNTLKAVYNLFKDNMKLIQNCSFILKREINENNIEISYTDGSFKKATNQASYSCCKLLEECSDEENSLFDEFLSKNFKYSENSGIIEDATNNIGELNGIKFAVQNFGDKSYQVIISDSEYSIKCFREWIWNWEKNNYRTYSKKPISNGDLIKEIRELMKKSNKIILLKWTKGHAKNSFNEKCDELAKQILGI